MRSRWLLLTVSVLCLLVLFPAAALSQGPRLNAGCGSATADGEISPGEWENAGRVALFGEEAEAMVYAPSRCPDVEGTQAEGVSGELWAMNDAHHLYLAVTLALDHVRLDPDYWWGYMFTFFTDEPDALDDQWAAPDWGPPLPGEGWVWAYMDPIVDYVEDWFTPVSQGPGCQAQPLAGVSWAAEPDRTVVWEYAFDLDSSPLDKVGPGDCFRLGLMTFAEGCELGTGCESEGVWVSGGAVWPEGCDFTVGSFGEACLNSCVVEEEFVPESGTILLLGGGLMGLAGYAGLRWRMRE